MLKLNFYQTIFPGEFLSQLTVPSPTQTMNKSALKTGFTGVKLKQIVKVGTKML